MSETVKTHRWSGWPGAICLDCGQEDENEHCLAVHDIAICCAMGHPQCEEHGRVQCVQHVNGPCPGAPWAHMSPYSEWHG